MSECHASKCHEPATTALRIGNNYSFRERPAGPLFYCDEHVEKVGGTMHDRGLRVYLEPMDRGHDPLTSKMIHEVFGSGRDR